jgi:hypothetical protein
VLKTRFFKKLWSKEEEETKDETDDRLILKPRKVFNEENQNLFMQKIKKCKIINK